MDRKRVLTYVGAGLAMLVMLALAPFYFAAGLMAPGWAVAVLMIIWLALFVLGCLWFKRRPLRVLALPPVALAVWFGGMSAGGALLGWTP